jgi:hypothetical protein
VQHLFLHVPKTAGSSIRTLLKQNYAAESMIGFSGELKPLAWYRSAPPEFKHRHTLVHGHFPYGLHEGVPAYTYFTFLRDPVDRHFSDFHFLKRYEPHPMHARIASGEIGLAEWADIFERQPMYRNIITGYVSGEGAERQSDRASLERAKFNLLRDFTFCGLTERFDESVLILARRLGWLSVFYLTKNVSTDRVVPDDLRQRTRANLELDEELYAFARREFDAAPELSDPLFAEALAEYRAAHVWLETQVINDASSLFEVEFDLPSIDALVRRHHTLRSLTRFLQSSSAGR